MAVDVSVTVTLIGDVGLLAASGDNLNVNLTFWLLKDASDLDDRESPDQNVFPVTLRSMFHCLREQKTPHMGKTSLLRSFDLPSQNLQKFAENRFWFALNR